MAEGLEKRVNRITGDKDHCALYFLASLISELNLSVKAARSLATLYLKTTDRDLLNLKLYQEVAIYHSFDPKVIMNLMFDAHTLAHEQAVAGNIESIEIIKQNTVVTFTSDMTFIQDLLFLCLMFNRRVDFNYIMKKGPDATAKIMRLLKYKYNINTAKRKPGIPLDTKIITIPRIVASFPAITIGLFSKGTCRSVVDASALFPGYDLPRAVLSPMIASMIPHQVPDSPLAVLLCIAVKVDDICHQTVAKTGLMRLYQYLMANYNFDGATESFKLESCKKWSIVVEDNGFYKFAPSLLDCRARAKDIIRSSRSTEPALDAVLNRI